MSEHNKQIAVRYIEAMGNGDPVRAAACLAPDVITVAKGFGKFAGARHYQRMIDTIGAFKQLIPTGLRPTIHSITAQNDRVVVEWEGNATLANGTPYCNQYCMAFTFHEGKIIRVHEYFCTLLADGALWPLLQARAQQQTPQQ